MNKRFFLKSWLIPSIATVAVPSHAQTSATQTFCDRPKVAGEWMFDGASEPTLLLEDGTVRFSHDTQDIGTWDTGSDDNSLGISFVGGDSGYFGTLNSSCTEFTGESVSIFPDVNGQPISATKRN